MSKFTLIVAFLLVLSFANAQTGNVGIGTSTPDASTILDIKSTNKGLLIPRVALTSTTDATTIASPEVSLLVYNTATLGTYPNNVVPGYYYNSGTKASPKWTRVANQNTAWQTNGNTGTTNTDYNDNSAQTNDFMGTTDNQPVSIYTNSKDNYNKTDIKLYNTTNASNVVETPTDIFHIRKNGRTGIAYPEIVSFALGKYAAGIQSKTELGIRLGDGSTTTADKTIMTLRGDGTVGIGTTTPAEMLSINGTASITSNNTLEFGKSVSGKESNAGKIGYQTFTTGALDIVGAGASGSNRIVKVWDNLVTASNVISGKGIVSGNIQTKTGPGTGSDNTWHTVELDANYGAISISAYATGTYLDGDIKMQGVEISPLLSTTSGWYSSNGNSWGSNSTTKDASSGTTCDGCSHQVYCPNDYIATGWQAYANSQLDYYLKLRCTKLDDAYATVESGAGEESVQSFPRSTSDNITHVSVCPTGTFIKGLYIYTNSYLDGYLTVYCTGIKKK